MTVCSSQFQGCNLECCAASTCRGLIELAPPPPPPPHTGVNSTVDSGERYPLGGKHRVLAPFHLLDKSYSLQGLGYSSDKVKNIISS